jgi:hypothetical protein
MSGICGWLTKRATWGYDVDGDLTLKVGCFYFTFFKYRTPIVQFNTKKNSLISERAVFVQMTDSHALTVWEKTRVPTTELVVIDHENKRHKEKP